MEEGRYYLRSSTREEHIIPVQLQMHTDQEFLTQTLGAGHPTSGKVFSDQSSTSSDLDISDLLNTSDHSVYSPKFGSGKSTKSAAVAGGSMNNVRQEPSQVEINKQILTQLSLLVDRLSHVEKVQN